MLTRKSAPQFDDITRWLNSPPLQLDELKGKTVLVQFWTFSCINWIRTLPFVSYWHDTYRDKGLVVIGIHSPEFVFEKDTGSVETAMKRFGVTYPVAQDNNFATWKAFGNRYWPAQYLIDPSGNIVLTQFGEGNYRKMEMAIARLVGADPSKLKVDAMDDPDLDHIGTPELYLGSLRNADAIVSSQTRSAGTRSYSPPVNAQHNRFAFSGTWAVSGEHAMLAADGGGLVLRFHAPKVNLVAASSAPQALSIKVDGKPQPPVTVEGGWMYVLYEGPGGDHIMEITIPKAGLSAYTFTFG